MLLPFLSYRWGNRGMEVQVQRSVLPQLNLTVDYVTSGSALSGAQPSAPPKKKPARERC